MINAKKLDWQLKGITYTATASMLPVARSNFDEDPEKNWW